MHIIEPRDISIKLRGALATYNNKIIRIDGPSESSHDNVLTSEYSPTGFDGHKDISQESITIPKPNLGYFNYRGSSVYLYYDTHRRRYQLGLSADNLGVKGPDSLLRHLDYKNLVLSLAPYLYGLKEYRYPVLLDALDSIAVGENLNIALSPDISISLISGTINIYYRGIRVGKMSRNTPTFNNRWFKPEHHACLGV